MFLGLSDRWIGLDTKETLAKIFGNLGS